MLEASNRRSPKPWTDHGTESRRRGGEERRGEEEEEKSNTPNGKTAGERKNRRRPKGITKLYIILYKGIRVTLTSNS